MQIYRTCYNTCLWADLDAANIYHGGLLAGDVLGVDVGVLGKNGHVVIQFLHVKRCFVHLFAHRRQLEESSSAPQLGPMTS